MFLNLYTFTFIIRQKSYFNGKEIPFQNGSKILIKEEQYYLKRITIITQGLIIWSGYNILRWVYAGSKDSSVGEG